MAEQGFILDLDTKFLKNLEQADKALSKSVDNANQMTDAFASTTLGAGRFANTIQTLLGKIGQLGGLKIDDSGFARIDTTAMSAADKVNLLIQNMSRYKAEIQNIRASGQDTWLSPLDVDSAPKLKAAISDIEEIMKTDSTLKLVDQAALSNEVKMYKSALKELQLSDDERIKNAVDGVNNSLKRINKAFKQDESSTTRATNAYTKAMAAAEGTIAQRTNKIAKLQQVEKQLAQDEAKYAKELKNVRDAIQSLTKANEEATKSSKELNENQKPLINTAEQLKRAFALVFSVSAIRGYVNQMVRVRGEFELQQRALQAILGSKADADAIWEKTIALAVRSPFQVKELVTYTKQLAAYRVESDKLYETNKMLADISAGLGVDMNRLILAFGQVKAANYLRGTELRQFSEAGINILGELSDYFTNLEGRAVSVGEVFERVSKRMVTFADVEAVLKNITSKGGIFYNMQEIQAETLKGQISNLKDSIDIMLNEIGKNNEDVLKGTISLSRVVLDNWRTVAAVIQSAITVYGLLTAARIKDAIATGAWGAANLTASAQLKGLTGVVARFVILLKSAYAWILANPITASLAALAAVGTLIYKHIDRQNELNRAYDESVGKIAASRVEIQSYSKALIDLADKQNKLIKLNESLDSSSDEYKKNQEEIVKIESKRNELLTELNKTSPEFVRQIKNIATDTQALTRVASEYNEELRARLALEAQLNEGKRQKIDISEYNEAYAKQQAVLGRVEASQPLFMQNAQEALSNKDVLMEEKMYIKEFLNSVEPFYIRVQKFYSDYLRMQSRVGPIRMSGMFDFSEVYKLASATNTLKELEGQVIDTYSSLAENYKLGDLGKRLVGTILSAEATEEDKENAKNNIIDFWDQALSDAGLEGELKAKVQEKFSSIFGFDWIKNGSVDLLDWQNNFNSLLEDLTVSGGLSGVGSIEDQATTVADQLSKVEESLKSYKNTRDSFENAKGQGVISEDEYDAAKRAIPILEQLRAFLGGYDKENTRARGIREEKTLSNRIRLVKELYEEYKKLRKVMGHTEAEGDVSSAYQDSFALAFGGTGISLDQFDFTTVEGVIAMLNKLKPLAEKEGQEAKIALQREIGEIGVTIKVEDKERADADFAQSIEDMFSGYELSLELDKLNIPRGFAEQFFGLKAFDLRAIKDRLEQEKSLNKEIGKDRIEKIEEALQKVKELESKAQQERLKEYVQYLVKGQGERVKIKMEELRRLSEIEALPFSDSQKSLARQAVGQESREKIDKLDWEEFKDSGLYVQLFEDLEHASDSALELMRNKLSELKGALKDLDADDLKHMHDQIEKIDRELAERNPYKTLKENAEAYIKAIGKQRELEDRYLRSEQQRSGTQSRVNATEEELANAQHIYAEMGKGKKATKAELDIQREKVRALTTQLSILKAQLIAQGKMTDEIKNQLDDVSQTRKMFSGAAEDIGGDISSVSNALPELAGHMENVFGTMSQGTKDTIESITTIGAGIGDAIQGFASGNYVQAVLGVAQAIGGIFAIGDKSKERQIQRQLELVEDLQKEYDKLEIAMDKAYSTQQVSTYSLSAKKNMEDQIRSYEQMIALEEDKKKRDDEKIEEWKEDMAELEEAYAEMIEEGFSKVSGGILDDALSTAKSFVDAWLEAFRETGDGLSGLEEEFSSMIEELITQQAAMQIVGAYTDMYKDWLKDFIDVESGDTVLTAEEAAEWAQKVRETFPRLSEALEQFFSGTQDLMQEQGELSELSKGIQGVTESTAQVLEALLNSMRFYVADSNMRLQNIEAAFASEEVSRNPILNELRQQTQMIRSIESMFDSVIGRGGSSHVGGYIKVKID